MLKSKILASSRFVALMLALFMICGVAAGCGPKGGNESSTSALTGSTGEDSEGGTDSTGDGTTDTSDPNAVVSGDETTSTSGNKTSSTSGDKTSSTSGNKTSSTPGSETLDTTTTKGKTFIILSAHLPEKESSDDYLFEQLFFKRVREVEKKYECTIKIVTTMLPTATNLAPLIQAGKQVANVIEVEMRDLPPLVAAGYVTPWTNLPGINVNDSKYNASYTKLGAYSGKYYGLQYMKPPELRYCVIMNKNLLKAKGINADGIYDLIKSKKWNFDKLLEYAKATTNASSGVYGVGGDPDYFMEMVMAANNANIVTMNNGKGTPTYASNKVIESLEFMNKLINIDKVYMTNSKMFSSNTYIAGKTNYIDQFIKGKLTFLFEDSWVLNQQIRPKVKNFDYGMISIPMGPSGTNYTPPSGHARVFCVTSTNKELAFTSKIFNAIAEQPSGYSGDQWWKDEIQLDYFQKNDSKSLDVYLSSLNNMSFDPGVGMDTVFDKFLNSAMRDPIFFNSGKSVAASVKSIEGTLDASIKNMFK